MGEHLADLPAAVVAQPAKNLSVTVGANSALAKKIEPLTVADIALTPRDAFVANMATGASATQRASIAAKAGELWEKAIAAKRLADGQL